MFVLANPWVLCLLPLPVLLWFLVPPLPPVMTSSLKVPFFEAIQQIVHTPDNLLTRYKGLGGLLLIWSCLVLALAGPRWVGPPQALARDSYNIMMVLDISPSMEINDMLDQGHRVTRLFAVQKAATEFVAQRIGDRVGLILFGQQAYLLTPLTYDRQNVMERIADASVGLAGKTTSIGDALGLAIKRLEQVPATGRMIVLLTDGVSNSGVLTPRKAAELAQSKKIQINTIGLHATIDPHSFDGMFLSLAGAADLDEATLKTVAKMTGGRYFRATNPASLSRIYQFIDKMTRVSQAQATVRPQYDYYPWFLSLGLLGLMGRIARRAPWLLSLGQQRKL